MELGTKRNEVQLSFVPWLLSFLVLLPMPSGATRRPRGIEPYYRCPISELFHGCLDQGSLVISRVEAWSNPTNHDARFDLTPIEYESCNRVHRLDQLVQ